MAKAWKTVLKWVRNLADDALVVAVTTACVLLASYWPTVRAAMVEHRDPSTLEWPSAVVTLLALGMALVLVGIDANTGDATGKAQHLKQRIARHALQGIGWLAIMERALGSG